MRGLLPPFLKEEEEEEEDEELLVPFDLPPLPFLVVVDTLGGSVRKLSIQLVV